MHKFIALTCLLLTLSILTACEKTSKSPAVNAASQTHTPPGESSSATSPASLISSAPGNARVYFIEPADGDTVPATFTVRFGLSAMGVAPAGVNKDNTGHHHILIDVDKMPNLAMPLPATDNIRHFGGGQTETQLTLQPGTHTLQLLLGNFAHVPHQKPVMSERITVTVE